MKNRFAFLMLLIILFISGCNLSKKGNKYPEQRLKESNEVKKEEEEIKPDENEKLKFVVVDLYFFNPDKGTLDIEKRQLFDLNEKTSMIKQVLRSLKLGPVGDLKPTIPENVEFKDVFIYRDTVYIDIHIDSNPSSIGGVSGEEMFIESVVKTVLSLSEDYKSVVFLVDGRQVDSLLGHIDCFCKFNRKSFD